MLFSFQFNHPISLSSLLYEPRDFSCTWMCAGSRPGLASDSTNNARFRWSGDCMVGIKIDQRKGDDLLHPGHRELKGSN